jgi:hypothetical protein
MVFEEGVDSYVPYAGALQDGVETFRLNKGEGHHVFNCGSVQQA